MEFLCSEIPIHQIIKIFILKFFKKLKYPHSNTTPAHQPCPPTRTPHWLNRPPGEPIIGLAVRILTDMLWCTQHPANPHRFCATCREHRLSGCSTADGVTIPTSPPRFEQICRTPILESTFPTGSWILMAASMSEILCGNLCLAATRYLGWVVS